MRKGNIFRKRDVEAKRLLTELDAKEWSKESRITKYMTSESKFISL